MLALLLLAGTGARSGLAQDAPVPRLAGVEVEGTTILDPQRVAALSGLPGTAFLTSRAMQEAIRTLWNTSLFDDVRIDTRPVEDGVVPSSPWTKPP